ncbi:MAG TPA: (d)CMP kinase [Bacillales bacterium]|nr:(d)CMP kinase [Bacillales bacterium]
MEEKICIAIDGPAAAGKSTVAKTVARRLGYVYIDTGAMYRALTLKVLNGSIDPEDEKAVASVLENTAIELIQGNAEQRIMLDGTDVTEEIRTDAVSNNVSFVARHKEIRREMVRRQRSLALDGGVVMDGRDIGTNVLPHAEVKIFLSASVEVRAERRHKENRSKGLASDFEQLKKDIEIRDRRDSERQEAPLVKAEDAVELDTTALMIDEVVEAVLRIVAERVGER